MTSPNQPVPTCALCAVEDDPSAFVFAGATVCVACHERMRSAVAAHLEPEAARAGRPIEYFLSALAYARRDGHWVVHLHTFQPGLVIGRQGATAQNIRQSLIEVTGDGDLRLNIASHDFDAKGCSRQAQPS
ncbi:MAG TPA: hypothetical protein VF230_15890 [Acidimicrobiales bacterium]